MSSGLLQKVQDYVSHNYRFLLYCLAISLLAFGFEIFSVSISIDEEVASLTERPLGAWLRLDRWGMYGLNWLLQDGPPLPYFNMLLGIAANLGTFLICLEVWSLKTGAAKYFAAVFALTHPTIAFVYAFNQSQYGYYIGLLLAVLGVWVFVYTQNRKSRLVLAIALWILALSIYQSVIFVAPTVYLLHRLLSPQQQDNHNTAFRNDIIDLSIFLGCLLAAVFLYEMISHLIRATLHIEGRYHTIENFYNGAFLKNYNPIFVIKEVTAQLVGHRWYVGYLTGLVLCSSILILIRSILKRSSNSSRKYLSLLFLLGAILSPFIFVILTAQFWPARTMMALPVMITGVVYLAFQNAPTFMQPWIGVLIALCFIGFVQSNTKLFYADYVTWQNDKLLVNRIVGAIETKYGDQLGPQKTPIVFLGHPARSHLAIRKREEHFGASILEWDKGTDHRILSVFRLVGSDYFISANATQITKAKHRAMGMPNWPSPGSITLLEGIIVVKFSDGV